ncbi:sensor histidine kinase [Streptomyces sp. NBC_01320]|uniref:sensor histidine kinase n=1 Tax=Streptomyces sp. NBC_01320 TaxID=2903824 RepID=UPI002E0FC79E|nr:histidine kinase [Streptomyces sp. NBC_01320]WSK01044.1 histidine kinase [Streptomyces sp. NBC_01320]
MPYIHMPPARLVCGDVALWSVLAAATGYGFRDAGVAPSPVQDLCLPLAVLAVAVPLSRRRPGTAVVLVNGLCALGMADSATPANAHVLSLAALSCLLGARVAAARRPLLVLASCLAVDLATCAVLRTQAVWWFYALTVLPAALLLPWLAGRHWRGRRELVREGWRLARSLEERQHLVAERARLTERADIAADMHDSLGHALSLVALCAGALELSPDLTDRDRTDLAELRGTIADAVEQLRETVAVLHDPAGTEPGTGLPVTDTVEDLLGRAAASGVPVRWEQHGAMPILSALVQRGIYRAVQEALTNAVKHAPDGEIRVRISHEADRTRVNVVNAAPPADRPAFAAEGPMIGAGGRGLTGLRERVTVLGGSLWTGPYQGGFRVTAVLPHQVAACPGTPTPQPETAPAPCGPHAGSAHPGTDTVVPESVKRLASVRNAARRRLRGSCRRSRLLRTLSRLPGLAVDNQRAAAVPVRRADHRPAPRRTRFLAAGPRLPLPARPRPFRTSTARSPLRVLPIRPRPVDRGRPLPALLVRQHAGDEGHRARKPTDSPVATFRTVEEELNRSDPGLVKIITDQQVELR